MPSESQKHFDAAAAKWDENPVRAELGRKAAAAILGALQPSPDAHAMDIGCATGTVTLNLCPHFAHIVAVDNSAGMIDMLSRKTEELGVTNVTALHADLTHDPLPAVQLDVIFSSMALHHMPDPDTLLQRVCGLLRPGGRVCILDLDEEDGSFHGDDASVAHHGFSAERMDGMLLAAGMVDIESEIVREIERTREEDGTVRAYPILMTLGRKP